jgi:hypothetical protein
MPGGGADLDRVGQSWLWRYDVCGCHLGLPERQAAPGTEIAAAGLPVALLAITPADRLSRAAWAALVISCGAWVTAVLAR